MKLFNAFIGIILFFNASLVTPATINGRFTVLNATSSEFVVLMQINTNTGADDLGGATIVFGFDTAAIGITENPVINVDYIFHNFCGGNYSPASVTRPMANKMWINIDLPFINNNNGTLVAASPEWTDVVTIHFDVVDPSRSSSLSWLTTSPFWGIYDADNSTLWETGEFEELPTSVEEGQEELPTSFELSQNYPNPFNPSTKIRFAIPASATSSPQERTFTELKVYDILGNEVATLVNEEKEPGIYEIEFSAINLASGIYIYRMQSAKYVETKKMVLLR